jgi:uncharacterized protein YqeY
MSLKDQLSQDLLDAMRAKDVNRLNAIRMLKTAISNYEIARGDPNAKNAHQPVTEAELLGVVEKQIKQRRESIEVYQEANRPELAATEQAEIDALERYMPKQLSRQEVRAEVDALIVELGTREFPKVMRAAAARLKGRADGKLVNEVVKQATG